MPINSIDKTIPSAARSIAHSSAIPGAAKLIDSTSNPCSAFSKMHSATATTCSRPIGYLSRRFVGSCVTVECEMPEFANVKVCL